MGSHIFDQDPEPSHGWLWWLAGIGCGALILLPFILLFVL